MKLSKQRISPMVDKTDGRTNQIKTMKDHYQEMKRFLKHLSQGDIIPTGHNKANN